MNSMNSQNSLGPAVRQHSLDELQVSLGYQSIRVELALALGRLLGKYVTGEGMTAFYLPAGGDAEPFRRALVGF